MRAHLVRFALLLELADAEHDLEALVERYTRLLRDQVAGLVRNGVPALRMAQESPSCAGVWRPATLVSTGAAEGLMEWGTHRAPSLR